jgi:TonB-linked SusC/RagA family outer membrane protein
MYKFFTNYSVKPPGYAKKILCIMKIAFVIVFATILQVGATTTWAQKINLSEKKTTMVSVFNKIKQQSGYDFIYNEELIGNFNAIDIKIENATVEQAVAKCLAPYPLDFTIKNKVVVIKRKLVNRLSESIPTLAADTIISGVVLEAQTRQPIPGATITVKGKNVRTQTNVEGKFKISVPKGATLVATSVGFTPQEIVIVNIKSLIFTLSETAESMKELVVNGLFTRKAETYTGATTTFSKLELEQAGNVNLIQSLRNLDPAFQIIDNLEIGSNPNALPSITLRGSTGLPDFRDQYATDPNQPLFILDGFETTLTKVIDLDMTRVKSVTLLKDAASKAIYGAQAANGVVVIETIRPTAGKLQTSYNYVLNIQAPDLSSYDLTNAAEKLDIELAGGVYSGGATNAAQQSLAQQYAARLALVRSGVNTDWLSKPLRNGYGGRHALAVSGGDQSFLYNVQLTYNDTKGVMQGSDRLLYGGTIDLNYRAKKFSFRNQLSVDLNKATNSKWGNFSEYAAMNPYLAFSDANGNISKIATQLSASNGFLANTAYNPAYNSTLSGIDESKYTQLINNFSVDWRIANAFRVIGSLNLTKQITSSDLYLPADHTSFTGTTEEEILRKGSYVKGNGTSDNVTARLQAAYNKVIGKHSMMLNLQGDIRSNSMDNVSVSTRGFPNDKLNDIRFALEYAENTTPTGSESVTHDLGASASGNYSWDNRAIADFSYRTNASSQFGRNSRWGSFWSAGIGWNFHNEKFIEALKFINNFQIRATTGYTGSQGFSSAMSLSTYNYELDQIYNGSYGANISNLANPDIQWQRRYDTNFGLNIGLWKKLDLVFDYYISRTDGLVTSITLPPSVGWTTVNANLGTLENKGFDFRANYRLFSNAEAKSSMSVFLTASRNRSILKKISNGLDSWNDQQDAISSTRANNAAAASPKVRFIEGQSMNSIWAVQSLGIDPGSGNEVYLKSNGEITYTWSAADQIVAGTTEADVQGNFGISWTYRGFNVSAAMRYRLGGQMYNSTLVSKVENADIRQNVDRRLIEGRWRNPGDISFYKALSSTVSTQPTTRFVEDDNSLTISSVNVSYDFQEIKRLKNLGFSRIRVTAGTSDLFQWASTTIERGTAYPFARTIQLSLNASF